MSIPVPRKIVSSEAEKTTRYAPISEKHETEAKSTYDCAYSYESMLTRTIANVSTQAINIEKGFMEKSAKYRRV